MADNLTLQKNTLIPNCTRKNWIDPLGCSTDSSKLGWIFLIQWFIILASAVYKSVQVYNISNARDLCGH